MTGSRHGRPDRPSLPEEAGIFGLFAISVHTTLRHGAECGCPACGMTARTIRLALAEAASEWFEKDLRDTFVTPVQILKPAAGYAACPDHTLKKDILDLLPGDTGIIFTDSFAMIPDASICGLVFPLANTPGDTPATYPDIRRISPDTARKYAAARGFSPEQTRQFLGHLL